MGRGLGQALLHIAIAVLWIAYHLTISPIKRLHRWWVALTPQQRSKQLVYLVKASLCILVVSVAWMHGKHLVRFIEFIPHAAGAIPKLVWVIGGWIYLMIGIGREKWPERKKRTARTIFTGLGAAILLGIYVPSWIWEVLPTVFGMVIALIPLVFGLVVLNRIKGDGGD